MNNLKFHLPNIKDSNAPVATHGAPVKRSHPRASKQTEAWKHLVKVVALVAVPIFCIATYYYLRTPPAIVDIHPPSQAHEPTHPEIKASETDITSSESSDFQAKLMKYELLLAKSNLKEAQDAKELALLMQSLRDQINQGSTSYFSNVKTFLVSTAVFTFIAITYLPKQRLKAFVNV